VQKNMPFIKVYIHFVWCTKNRTPFLDKPELRKLMWFHIKENAINKQIIIDCINGYDNHCHCLVSLKHNQTIQDIMQFIKGESSHWFNQQAFIVDTFYWQNDYYAVSVAKSEIIRVRNYIKNQESHHCKVEFQSELDEFIKKNGFEKFSD
jgi:REP element-mobilizing transposase RayT